MLLLNGTVINVSFISVGIITRVMKGKEGATKRFHLVTARLSKDQRNQVIVVLEAASTVNDITRHFGCSRQTILYLMNWYNKTGYARVHERPGRARVTTLRPYRVNLPT